MIVHSIHDRRPRSSTHIQLEPASVNSAPDRLGNVGVGRVRIRWAYRDNQVVRASAARGKQRTARISGDLEQLPGRSDASTGDDDELQL